MIYHIKVVDMMINDYIAKTAYIPVISGEVYSEFDRHFKSFYNDIHIYE